ncbi:MAG: ABC transporter substrate-binding protein [Halanaerobiales bacterium]|nr:ABC transporter substrate-binding protein [Halanaerobiales bacterium]
MKKLLMLVMVGLMLLSSVAFAGSDVVKIGLSAPITGNYAEFGENFRYSVQMAADKINAAGGINGRQIEIVVMDSKGDPREAAIIAQRFVQDKKIVAEIGDFTSTSCLAAAPIYERNGMVQLSPTASHPAYAPSGTYMFGIVGTQDAEGPFNVKYIAQDFLEMKNVAVIYINNDWGVVTKDRFVSAAKEFGLNVTSVQPFFEGERDFNAILTKMRQTNPDGIYIAAMYNEASLVARQIQKMGWDVKMSAPSSVFSDNLLTLGGEAVEGLATNTFFALNDPNPEVQEFITEFKERAGRDPNLHAACAYDTMMILAEAIEKAGFDRKDIRDALAQTENFQGVTGSITFTKDGDVIRKYKIMVVENGEWVIKKDYTH